MQLKTEKYYSRKYRFLIGIDEAGRGPWAGPITVGAVFLDLTKISLYSKHTIFKSVLKETKDSKKLPSSKRENILHLAKRCPCLVITTSSVQAATIDKFNIEQATQIAIKRNLIKLQKNIYFDLQDTIILIDGNRKIKTNKNIVQKTIIKGDDKVFAIALASIAAKVTRDRKMIKLSSIYPQYHFEQHKGYGTKLHRQAIKKYGLSPIHRRSYKFY